MEQNVKAFCFHTKCRQNYRLSSLVAVLPFFQKLYILLYRVPFSTSYYLAFTQYSLKMSRIISNGITKLLPEPSKDSVCYIVTVQFRVTPGVTLSPWEQMKTTWKRETHLKPHSQVPGVWKRGRSEWITIPRDTDIVLSLDCRDYGDSFKAFLGIFSPSLIDSSAIECSIWKQDKIFCYLFTVFMCMCWRCLCAGYPIMPHCED